MPSTPKKSQKTSDEELVKDLKKKVDSWWSYSKQFHNLWNDYYAMYRSRRTSKQSYDGNTNTVDPIVKSSIDTLVAGIISNEPKWEFVPTLEDQNPETDVLNALMSQFWEQDKWDPKAIMWVTDVKVYGTGIMYMYWDIDRPRIMNIPVRDWVFDPTAANPDESEYQGRRFLAKRKELEEAEKVSPDTGELEPLYDLSSLDDYVDKNGNSGEDLDKANKESFLGSTLDKDVAYKEQIECIEITTKDKVYTLANRRAVIRNEENPLKTRSTELIKQDREELKAKLIAEGIPEEQTEEELGPEEVAEGLIPYIVQRNYPDQSLMYGISEIEPIMRQSEYLNDVESMILDSGMMSVNPPAWLDAESAEYQDEIDIGMGKVVPYGPEEFGYHVMPQIPSGMFNIEDRIKDSIRETTGASQVAKGVDGSKAATLGEKELQLSAASTRFNVTVKLLEKDGFHTWAEIAFRMIQLFVDTPIWVRVAKAQGLENENFQPEDFIGEYQPRVKLDTTVQQETQEKQQELFQLYELYLQVAPDPMKVHKIFGPKVTKQLTQTDIEEIFAPPEGPIGDPLAQGLPPEQIPTEGVV